MPSAPVPTEIKLHRKSRVIELVYHDDQAYRLSFEFLRVHSPSAEVRGHGPGQEILQTDKQDVDIVQLEAVGQYAVRPIFSDGHDSGLYSWDYLRHLCLHRDELWQAYHERLAAAGHRYQPIEDSR
ncbi:MAG TPA: DUF971 domain-containing protein [Rhodocyclaceae bacterium]|nr:DUF971 domain-containing protein [Rhodocyclaceae bacterium]